MDFVSSILQTWLNFMGGIGSLGEWLVTPLELNLLVVSFEFTPIMAFSVGGLIAYISYAFIRWAGI